MKTKKAKLKRNTRRFQFVATSGKEETVDVCANQYGGVLFVSRVSMNYKDWDALVKWVDQRRLDQ